MSAFFTRGFETDGGLGPLASFAVPAGVKYLLKKRESYLQIAKVKNTTLMTPLISDFNSYLTGGDPFEQHINPDETVLHLKNIAETLRYQFTKPLNASNLLTPIAADLAEADLYRQVLLPYMDKYDKDYFSGRK